MKEKTIICQQCNKKIVGRFPNNKKFCSNSCKDKYSYMKYPNRMKKWRKNNKERNKINAQKHYQKNKELYEERSKIWALNNPEKKREVQTKSIKKYYYKNHERMKLQLKENAFIFRHRKEIFDIIGKICNCGEKATEIHHIQYDNLPREKLEEYCKFLKPLCKNCHYKIHHTKRIKTLNPC